VNSWSALPAGMYDSWTGLPAGAEELEGEAMLVGGAVYAGNRMGFNAHLQSDYLSHHVSKGAKARLGR
jgi:hypothetical protein